MPDDLLAAISPVQFIEGLNEGERPDREGIFPVHHYPAVAFRYSPRLTYCLVGLELWSVWSRSNEAEKYRVDICNNYAGGPGDILLSSGEVFLGARSDPGAGWLGSEFLNPVVLVAEKNYWVVLRWPASRFVLGKALGGRNVPLKAIIGGDWYNLDPEHKGKVMARFYGRILPVP